MTLLDDLENPTDVHQGELRTEGVALRWNRDQIELQRTNRPWVTLGDSAIQAIQLSYSEQPGKRTMWHWLSSQQPKPILRLHAELRGRDIGRLRFYSDMRDAARVAGLPRLESSGELAPLQPVLSLLVAARVHGANLVRTIPQALLQANPELVAETLPGEDGVDVEHARPDPQEVKQGGGRETVSVTGQGYGFKGPGGGLITALYKDISKFSNGRAAVRGQEDGLWGYINPSGQVVVPLQFTAAFPFNADGIAEVIFHGRLLEIDVEGKHIRTLGRVSSEAHVGPERELPALKTVSLGEDSSASGVQEYAIPDAVPPTTEVELESFREEGLYGFKDPEGNVRIRARLLDVSRFVEGLAAARDASTERWGYIRPDGGWAVRPTFEAAFDFKGGVAEVIDDGRTRRINTRGAFVD